MSVMGTSNILKSGISNHKKAIEIRELLERASKAYYETEHKILSDDEYDVINDLYEKYTGEIVSGSKGTTSMAHGYSQMMSTLKKAKNLEEFEVWLTDTAREAIGSSFDRSVDNLALILSNKLDGNSILIEYEEGRAKRAVTRGKDGLGVDVTGIFARRSISEPLTCGIKYEAVCANSNMDAVSKLRGKELVDARSAITGILGRDNGDRYDKFIDLFPIDASIGDTTLAREDVTDLLGTLHDNNTLSCGFTKISGTAKQVMAQIAEIYERNVNTRINWDHSVDGLVIEFMDESIRERLGWHEGTSIYPKFARALKYPPYEKTTEALRIEFDIGKTGRITPCVVFASVVINGRTYQRTSIANYRRFKELGVGEGTKLLFSLSNDVIGYLDVLDVPENKNIY